MQIIKFTFIYYSLSCIMKYTEYPILILAYKYFRRYKKHEEIFQTKVVVYQTRILIFDLTMILKK